VFTAVLMAAPALATTVKTIPDPETVSPGFAGFVSIFLLAVATVLLIRSMTKHLRKVRYAPEPPSMGDDGSPARVEGQDSQPGPVPGRSGPD
jgi:hypothetical protein